MPQAKPMKPIFERILDYSERRFDAYEIDPVALKEAADRFCSRHQAASGDVASLLERLLSDQGRNANFSDLIYLMGYFTQNPSLAGRLSKAYESPSIQDISPTAFLSIIEGRNSGGSQSFFGLEKLYQFPTQDVSSLDDSALADWQANLKRYWRDPREPLRRIYTFMFEVEEQSPSFRDWLEKQDYTEAIRKEFKAIGLDYNRWDDPYRAFGYTSSRIEDIVYSPQHSKEAVITLARELTRGEHTGHLGIAPNEAWSAIKQDYLQLKDASEEKKINELSARVLSGLEKCLSQGAKARLKKGDRSVKFTSDWEAVSKMISSKHQFGPKYNLAYQVWRRQPSYDFCEGDDAGVCTGINSGQNPNAMLHYLVDKSVSLVDITSKGRRLGQIYLFAAYESRSRTPVLVIDSVEMRDGTSIINSTMETIDPVVTSLAEEAGFKKILFNSRLHHSHSKGYYQRARSNSRTSRDYHLYEDSTSIRLTKVGGLEPVKSLSQFCHSGDNYNQTARGHYLDSLGGWATNTDSSFYGVVKVIK